MVQSAIHLHLPQHRPVIEGPELAAFVGAVVVLVHVWQLRLVMVHKEDQTVEYNYP